MADGDNQVVRVHDDKVVAALRNRLPAVPERDRLRQGQHDSSIPVLFTRLEDGRRLEVRSAEERAYLVDIIRRRQR